MLRIRLREHLGVDPAGSQVALDPPAPQTGESAHLVGLPLDAAGRD